jgi:hypothetical protein
MQSLMNFRGKLSFRIRFIPINTVFLSNSISLQVNLTVDSAQDGSIFGQLFASLCYRNNNLCTVACDIDAGKQKP